VDYPALSEGWGSLAAYHSRLLVHSSNNQNSMKLLIVTECGHYRRAERVLAPRHFVREISQWARMFDSVVLITRFPSWQEPADLVEYGCENITFRVGNGAFGTSLIEVLRSLARSTVAVCKITREYIRTDAVHIRCPSRHGLLALLVWFLAPKPCYVKWAGNWDFQEGVPWSLRLQRWLVKRMRGAVVATVYGRLDDDPPHIHETLTTSLNEEEVERCLELDRKHSPNELRLLWVGRSSSNKNTRVLLDVVERVSRAFPLVTLHLVGDGPDLSDLKAEAEARGIGQRMVFHGSQPWQRLCELYASARLLLLPSLSEGFPKVVIEAALVGTPSIVFACGALPNIVKNKGVAVKPIGDNQKYVQAVLDLLADEARWEAFSANARNWASQISIESVVDGYRRMIETSWNVKLLQG